MPLYNYLCSSCKCNFEAANKMDDRGCNICPQCGIMARQTISRRPAAIHGFKYGKFEDIALEPIYVKGKRHLQVLCDEHECYAPGALD